MIFLSVSEHLPRSNEDNEVFEVEGELTDERSISIQTTFKVLRSIMPNEASWPDHADLLASTLIAIFNCSLREGKLPK